MSEFFLFLFNFQRHSLILGYDSYADCHILGRGKGINSEILLLLILNLHVFKINQFWNMKWWFFIIYIRPGVSKHSFSGLDHIRDYMRHFSIH